MIVWGGAYYDGNFHLPNTGGRYSHSYSAHYGNAYTYSNAYCYGNAYTYSNTDADPMHRKMFTHAKAAPNASASPLTAVGIFRH
jgi:hypothetical protein